MYYIGVDGGGTKTKFVMCDNTGRIVTENVQTTANYLQVGYDGLTEILKKGVNALLHDSKLTEHDISNAFVGCSGFGDVKKDEIKIKNHIKEAFGNIKHQVGNDGENAMAGALAGKDGINIVAGTGSIAFGHNSINNQTGKCGGWHQAIGSDEGSGYWISIELLKAFERQADERYQKTLLYEEVIKKLSLEDDSELITRVVEEWDLDRTKIASLAQVVSNLYDANDPYAIDIIKRAANELADIVISLYKKLHFSTKIVVSYTGGIWKMGSKIIKPFSQALKDYDIEILPPVFEPDIGSLILALKKDEVEITETILTNLSKNDNR